MEVSLSTKIDFLSKASSSSYLSPLFGFCWVSFWGFSPHSPLSPLLLNLSPPLPHLPLARSSSDSLAHFSSPPLRAHSLFRSVEQYSNFHFLNPCSIFFFQEEQSNFSCSFVAYLGEVLRAWYLMISQLHPNSFDHLRLYRPKMPLLYPPHPYSLVSHSLLLVLFSLPSPPLRKERGSDVVAEAVFVVGEAESVVGSVWLFLFHPPLNEKSCFSAFQGFCSKLTPTPSLLQARESTHPHHPHPTPVTSMTT
mmetsp:Transcript_7815/g.11809  ORF Transcript_7815/g.11809 Transcript_7815/m.11809 type:complete len:251 (-) Transcript_7815:441-1193(-)